MNIKTKHLLLWTGALLIAASSWAGRAVWRAHQQLVTLHVHNVPLTEVLRKIERQTWTKIRAEKNLDSRITLNLDNKPVADVLERVAEQAGARCVTMYAVYGSKRALGKLEAALREDGKLEVAGWRKVAPSVPDLQFASEQGLGGLREGLAEGNPSDANLPPGAVLTATEDLEVKGAPGTNSASARPKQTRGRGPLVVRIARKGGAGGDAAVEQEVWTPEELIMDSALNGGDTATEATPEAAAQLARQVRGHWTTYVALHKSPFGIGFRPPRPSLAKGARGRVAASAPRGETNTSVLQNDPAPDLAAFGDPIGRQRNAEFGRLTPQQRVERARERQRFEARQN